MRYCRFPIADFRVMKEKFSIGNWRLAIGNVLLILLCMPLLPGCANPKERRDAERAISDYFVGAYGPAKERLRPYAMNPDRNFVLNNLRMGSAALAEHDLVEAEAAFLRAYEVLNSVGVNSGGRTLGAVLVDEQLRIWRGEPYERAMANFYLGIIYYMQEDWNNARGAFENALFKLRDYGEDAESEDQYREQESNFIIANLMLGKTWQKIGREDLARANFQRVIELRPELAALADYDRNLRSNVLLIVEYGGGPQKITGSDGSIVGFAPTAIEAGPIPNPRVLINGQRYPLGPMRQAPIDMLIVAQERRWQSIDTIRTVKSAVGTGAIVGGAVLMTDEDTAWAGLGLLLAGLALKATSQADVRQWEMLPRTVFVLPLEIMPGRHDLTVEFDGRGTLPRMTQTWRNIVAPSQGEATYYIRMQRWNSGPFEWPPRAIAESPSSAGPAAAGE